MQTVHCFRHGLVAYHVYAAHGNGISLIGLGWTDFGTLQKHVDLQVDGFLCARQARSLGHGEAMRQR
jgi:hypothetical protein